jgi:hypothetical protein
VSARTGEYRFLDLPGRAFEAGSAALALSADGRRLAYAIADERFDDQRLGGPGRVGGVAVYDSVTGRITTHRVESRLGLSLRGLAWAGTTVWFDYFEIDEVRGDGFSRSSGGGTFRWSFSGTGVASGEPQLLPGTERIAPSSPGAAPGGFIVGVGQRDFRVVVKDTVSHAFQLDADLEGAPALSPDGRTVVGLGTSDPSTSDGTAPPIMAGTLPVTGAFDRGLVHLRAVPGVTAHEVLGWRDATHVVAMTYGNQGPRIDSIDVGTGAVRPLMVLSGTNWMPGKIVAADAWSAPVVAVTEPRWPPDPRPFACAALLAAFAGAGYLLRRRRRARA